MLNPWKVILFLTIIVCPTVCQSTNESQNPDSQPNSLDLPKLLKGKYTQGEWTVSGPANPLFRGFSSGSASCGLDQEVERTVLGQLGIDDNQMIFLVIYLGDPMSTLKVNIKLGKFDSKEQCWRGSALATYIPSTF